MALYLVLHHPADPEQPWKNQWEPDSARRIVAITTRPDIARAANAESVVYIHRCAYAGNPPMIVCRARVNRMAEIDRTSCLVYFDKVQTLRSPPLRSIAQKTNSYTAPAPPDPTT